MPSCPRNPRTPPTKGSLAARGGGEWRRVTRGFASRRVGGEAVDTVSWARKRGRGNAPIPHWPGWIRTTTAGSKVQWPGHSRKDTEVQNGTERRKTRSFGGVGFRPHSPLFRRGSAQLWHNLGNARCESGGDHRAGSERCQIGLHTTAQSRVSGEASGPIPDPHRKAVYELIRSSCLTSYLRPGHSR